jgi:membrane fusion protein, multidrug efflux system
MKRFPPILAVALVACVSCGGKGGQQKSARNMEEIYKDEGVPVRLRKLEPESFSAYLKYPATLKAELESSSSASVSEVVREVRRQVGDFVRKGEVVVALSGDNASYQQARAALDTAEASFARYKSMFDKSDISPQDFDNVKVQYAQAKAAFKTIDDIVNLKAPISGYLTRLDVRVSDNTYPGAPLFTVSDLGAIEAKLYVTGEEARMVKPGQAALIEDGGRSVRGTVTQVSLIMDGQRKAFPVTASFPNPASAFTSGITVDVSLAVYGSRAIVVSQKEIVRRNDRYFAFVSDDGMAKRRELRLGRRDGLRYEVLSGLESGDELVAEGAQALDDGVKLRPVAAIETAASN